MPARAKAFDPLQAWFHHLTEPPTVPATDADWEAIAQMSFWCGRIQMDAPARHWLAAIPLDDLLEWLSLDLLAQLLLGRWELCGEGFAPWLRLHHDAIAARFRRETDTAWLEESNGVVRAHFLIGIPLLDGPKPSRLEAKNETMRGNLFHAEAMRRVDLLRGLFPNRAGFGCQGYGHRVLPLPYDDTTKTGIISVNLPPDWASGLNATAIAIVKWEARPPDWDAYIRAVLERRRGMVQVFTTLHRELVAHFRDRRKAKALGSRFNSGPWEALRDAAAKPTPLPKQAVDPWGFVSEGRETEEKRPDSLAAGVAVAAYKKLLNHQSDLYSALGNFLGQALPYLFITHGGEAGGALSRLFLEAFVQSKGRRIVEPRLVMFNLIEVATHLPGMQAEFRQLFAARISATELNGLEEQERKEVAAVLALWHAYQEQPEAHRETPGSWAKTLWELPVREVLRRIEHGFRTWQKDGIRAQVMARPDQWEGEGALWLRIDSDDSLQFWTAPQHVKELLRGAAREMLNDSQRRYALERRWRVVVIVPLVRGRGINRWAWRIPLYRFGDLGEETELSWVDNVPHSIGDELWQFTGLATWDSAELRDAHALFTSAGKMRVVMAHLRDWLPLVKQEGADIEVIQSFADRHSAEWSTTAQSLFDALGSFRRQITGLDMEEIGSRPYLVVAANRLSEHFKHWFPDAVLSKDGKPLSADAIEQWVADWTIHEEALFQTCGAVLVDAVERCIAR